MKTALILGAGIIGLSTALELAMRGIEVTVLERGEAMREASWAAAGMLAAHDPENPLQLSRLAQRSLALYPDYLRRLDRLSGHAIPLRTVSTLQVCNPHHSPLRGLIDIDEAMRRVPGLPGTPGGPLLWMEEKSLDPRDLCQALPVAACCAGVNIREHCAVFSMRSTASGILAETAQGTVTADCLISCTGAWSSHLPQHFPALMPKKGQMLAVRPTREPSLNVVLRSPEIYLVPRGDGRIIIGATVEDAGFDRSIDPGATAWLQAKAAALWPAVGEAAIEEVWTGLRPGSADGLPLIGPLAADGLWIAAGHYRNGILLAPATARLLADAILNPADSSSPDLADFHPDRFAAALAIHS